MHVPVALPNTLNYVVLTTAPTPEETEECGPIGTLGHISLENPFGKVGVVHRRILYKEEKLLTSL